MSRTSRHLLFALFWLGIFSLVAVAFIGSANLDFGHMSFYAQVGSLVWVIGFAGIFYSWAREDAPAHGKSAKSAVVFTALWFFFIFFAHVAYLFFTRGLRSGVLATLRFISFLLGAAIAWLLLGRLLHALF